MPLLPAAPREPRPQVAPSKRLVARLLERLGPPPGFSPHPALVVLVGPPGAGKTSFARRLAEAAPVAVVSSDWVRKTLHPTPVYSDRGHIHVFVHAFALVRALLRQGEAVVFDAINLRESGRRPLYRIATQAGARLAVVRLTAPAQVVRARFAGRTSDRAAWDLSDATYEVYEALAAAEEPVRRPHLELDTSGDVEGSLAGLAWFVGHPEAAPPSN